MVSGGTYGTEDIVHGAGYGRAILILLLTPLLWSLPTAFMIGELSSALPYEGGYYAWVRRAMGNFWGFQEAWLSLVASIFDMAIYPTLFVALPDSHVPVVRRRQSRSDGSDWPSSLRVRFSTSLASKWSRTPRCGCSSPCRRRLWRSCCIAPFKLGALAERRDQAHDLHVDIIGGLLICMWNYMGWDNASTIATEVERPQRTYPRAMLVAVLHRCR